MTSDTAMWIGLMLLGFAGSALYSGLETGAYTVNRIRLHVLAHDKRSAAARLHREIRRPTRMLSTLLIGNNLSAYLGTASLAVVLSAWGLGEWQQIVLNAALVTPVLFLFGETLPKDLFAAHADRLMYPLSRVLTLSRWLFTLVGMVPLITACSGFVMRTLGRGGRVNPFHPRRQVETLVREGVGYGLLSDEQSSIVGRVLELSQRTVRDEMVPWAKVVTVRLDDPPTRLWELGSRSPRSRFPVLDARGRVVGVMNLADALAHEPERCPPIRELMRQPFFLPASTPLRAAMGRLQRQKVALAVAADDRSRPLGVVTIKDLVEPITGELWNW